MSARKLVYRSMVVAPAVFLVGLGVHARAMDRDYDFVANDGATEIHIQAYVPYVRAFEALRARSSAMRPETVRTVTDRWICGWLSCKLRPLPPIAYDDTS